jgi:dCMP deaminase
MRKKHLEHRIRTCLSLASLSPCVRRKFGCVVVDPEANVILSEGYNGNLRGASSICGNGVCKREGLEPGTNYDIGCVHAEQNAIYNAARLGTSLVGAWFIINGEPCRLCAKAIVQVGAMRVICISGTFGKLDGVDILRDSGVKVIPVKQDMSDLSQALEKRLVIKAPAGITIPLSPFSPPT